MILKTEVNKSREKACLVIKRETILVKKIKQKLIELDIEVYTTNSSVANFEEFDICFFIDYEEILLTQIEKIKDTKFVFLIFDDEKLAKIYSSFAYEKKTEHIKVINLQTYPEYYDKDIDTIFWFTFSRTPDLYLHIFHQPTTSKFIYKKNKKIKRKITLKSLFTPKKLILLGLLILIMSQFIFFIPLGIASLQNYRSYKAFEARNLQKTEKLAESAEKYVLRSESLYPFSEKIFNFFSMGITFENIIKINKSASIILSKASSLAEDSEIFIDGVFVSGKSVGSSEEIIDAKNRLDKNIQLILPEITTLSQKLPDWNPRLIEIKEKLTQVEKSIETYEKFSPEVDSILASGTEKKYLILFANNMEIRPGGGFIGSFAIIKVSDYAIYDIRVYDVYDADGQLTTRIEPPYAISEYLNQPFWYLRDSAFEGDFATNLKEAENFLALEMGESDFDGGALITTTAVQYMLDAMDELYIPEYQDTITAGNFFLKTQLAAEKDFFPGSTQKKRFLSSVIDQMLVKISEADPQKLLTKIELALNQKQIVAMSQDPDMQTLLEQNLWTGSMIDPGCEEKQEKNCISNYIYQLDANLGVNKVNYFIKRPTELETTINDEGDIINKFLVLYENNSPEDAFPGGTYKNFVQTYLPPNSQILEIKIDGEKTEKFNESNFQYKKVEMMLNIKPKQSALVEFTYKLPTKIISGDGIYQFIYQKQVGSPNYDFSYTLKIPKNIEITRNNLAPLAPNNEINYNTSVSSDKVFLIEFQKK